jgi:hypothetical protein
MKSGEEIPFFRQRRSILALTYERWINILLAKGVWRSWLSRRPVKPEIAGSSPVTPESFFARTPFSKDVLRKAHRSVNFNHSCVHVPGKMAVSMMHRVVAQWLSALGSGPRGREFKSLQPEIQGTSKIFHSKYGDVFEVPFLLKNIFTHNSCPSGTESSMKRRIS